ncbi:hypothetical protein OIE69_44200 (plasmid) [Actinacidiphila glaucinigra]|uniref:hypothetical protein n=1 Tax=Actinacidiphila glaucinigra TaxID=235986 RepID=UPI002DDC21F9|nr:hypothetical protein [Actinacidiphila glaucinigra]WSD65907.1 hypothetical protein OIE69_44200 [Actinacidiphila glaucinigra]
MDQGIAALAGASIGIIGTLIAAHLSGRQQRAQWRRQVRRDAYGAFISRYDAAVRAGQAAELAIREDRLDTGIDQNFAEKVREARDALVAVQLEGPEGIAIRAESAMSDLDTWAWGLDLLISGDGTLTAEETLEFTDGREEKCAHALAEIIALGRKLLTR